MEKGNAIYDIHELAVPKRAVLGLQHMFAMFGATILVPILVSSQYHGEVDIIQVTLLCAGLGTLFFHAETGLKVPAFLGSSFAFLGGFATIAELNTGIYASMSYAEKYQYALGGCVVAGLMYLVLALIVKLVGVERMMHFLPPVVTGPIIICIGLSLAVSAINNASMMWPLASIAILAVVVFNVWGKGMWKIIPILMGVVISYIIALIMNAAGLTNSDGSMIVNLAAINQASLVGLPHFYLPKFDLTAILVMAPISIATMMEHIGDIAAISATTEQNFLKDPGLHRTLIGDGLASAGAGLIGGPPNTTYGENTGVLVLTKVYAPGVVRLAAVFAVVLSFSPKLSATIGTMPTAVIGGISFILYGMISSVGIRNIVENRVDFTESRNLIIAALILVTGLGFAYANTTVSFHVAGATVTLTSLALAALIGIVMNAILPGNTYVFDSNIYHGLTPNPPTNKDE